MDFNFTLQQPRLLTVPIVVDIEADIRCENTGLKEATRINVTIILSSCKKLALNELRIVQRQ